MSSESAGLRQSGWRLSRRGRRIAPWVLWGVAVVITIVLGRHVVGTSVAPGEAEAVTVGISPAADARIVAVKKRVGDTVQKGEVLVEFDQAQMTAELAAAKAELNRLELEVPAQLAALSDDERQDVARLSQRADEAALEVARIDAELKRDEAELAQLEQQLLRQQDLIQKGLAAAPSLAALELKKAALSQKITESKALRRAADGVARTARARERASSPKDGEQDQRLAPYRAAIEAQRHRIERLEAALGDLTLRAPFAGTVVDHVLREGDVARRGVPILTIVAERPSRVIAYVDERWARRVKQGDQARIVPSDGIGAIREGRVSQLGARIAEFPIRFRKVPGEPVFGRQVFIDIAQGGEPMLPGQAFNVSFTRGDGT